MDMGGRRIKQMTFVSLLYLLACSGEMIADKTVCVSLQVILVLNVTESIILIVGSVEVRVLSISSAGLSTLSSRIVTDLALRIFSARR